MTSKATDPFAAFSFVCKTFPVSSFNSKENSPAFKVLPDNSLVTLNWALADLAA